MCADADAFVGHLHHLSTDRRSEVATMCADADAFVGHLHRLSAGRRSEVTTMRADHQAFLGHLHRLSAGRHAEIWGGAAPVRAAARPVRPAVARPRAAAPAPPVEEAVPTAPAATAEAVTLRDVIFEYLAEHPDGARLTDMEREFGMARIQIATALRGLIDDNKVEKRDLVYFAI
jgi:hypothetical protein